MTAATGGVSKAILHTHVAEAWARNSSPAPASGGTADTAELHNSSCDTAKHTDGTRQGKQLKVVEGTVQSVETGITGLELLVVVPHRDGDGAKHSGGKDGKKRENVDATVIMPLHSALVQMCGAGQPLVKGQFFRMPNSLCST